jgi:hypothetical protein
MIRKCDQQVGDVSVKTFPLIFYFSNRAGLAWLDSFDKMHQYPRPPSLQPMTSIKEGTIIEITQMKETVYI